MKTNNFKSIGSIFFIICLFIILPLVFAQKGEKVTTIGDLGRAIGKWIADAFGYTELTTEADWRFVTILAVIFFMLFFAFSDIIESLTTFKKSTSYILGFGLAVIAALTKGILKLTRFAFGAVAALGVFAIVLVILSAFVAMVVIHFGVRHVGSWLVRRRIYAEAARFGGELKKGAEKLKQAARL